MYVYFLLIIKCILAKKHMSMYVHIHLHVTCVYCLLFYYFYYFSKNGVSYFNPSVHNEFSFYVERIKRSCSLLLFVITSNTTGVPELIEVREGEGGRERERGFGGKENERGEGEGVRNINTCTCTSYCCLYCIGCL